jgi:hypothetical protein
MRYSWLHDPPLSDQDYKYLCAQVDKGMKALAALIYEAA